MSIIAEAAVFFERVSHEDMDPDVAIRCLEDLAADLASLSSRDRTVFSTYIDRRAAAEKDIATSALLGELSHSLGLTST
jgi:hypothetical protein